jgi:hypothetical protein
VAKLLIDTHGEDAKARATQRVVDMRMIGDEAGAQVWRRVVDAVIELQAIQPEGGAKLH